MSVENAFSLVRPHNSAAHGVAGIDFILNLAAPAIIIWLGAQLAAGATESRSGPGPAISSGSAALPTGMNFVP